MPSDAPVMPSKTVFQTVQSALIGLTPAERKVARVVMADYPAAGLLTVAELGKLSGVSGQTVIRFTSTLGFSSYPQFQARLIEELKTRSESPLSLYSSSVGKLKPGGLAKSLLLSFRQALDLTFQNIPADELNRAVHLLTDKKNDVYITGGRFSDLLAEYFSMHVRQLRPGTVFLPSDSTLRTDSLVDVGRRTVVVVFDFRRYQASTITFASLARQRGARIVLFTDPYLSPIAKVAHLVIPLQVAVISPFDSFVAAVAVAELFVAAMTKQLGEEAHQRIADVEETRVTTAPPTDT
jgi:DNA-binding MurR/RpiR family transcriptional regulator